MEIEHSGILWEGPEHSRACLFDKRAVVYPAGQFVAWFGCGVVVEVRCGCILDPGPETVQLGNRDV